MKRNNKNYIIVLVLLLLVVISIGYAVLNTTLNITGKSNISKNTWDIHFENIQIKDGSVETVKIPTIDNNTTVDFETQLNLPGDYYEFTVDVVNNGTIDAMIESIVKEPELSTAQQKYLNYIIEYHNGEQLANKQLVEKESYVTLKVRVELRKDIDASDLPEVGDVLYLGFTVNYVQADENGISVNSNSVKQKVAIANGSLDEIGTIVTIGDQQFYTIGTEGNNVKLLSMYNLYVGNQYDRDNGVVPLTSPTGKQSENAIGWFEGFNVANPNIGTTAFSSDSQKGTNYSDYNGSIVEGYVNNYKNIIEKDYGVDVVEARLITIPELKSEEIGCTAVDYNYTCSNAPSFIYSTSYWSMTAHTFDSVWYVYSEGYFAMCNYDSDEMFGVRPVIVISKSVF